MFFTIQQNLSNSLVQLFNDNQINISLTQADCKAKNNSTFET
jgi:hypothetical protein